MFAQNQAVETNPCTQGGGQFTAKTTFFGRKKTHDKQQRELIFDGFIEFSHQNQKT
jgi:hypothetical protein